MKRLLAYADKYLQKSDWRDIGVIKFCLFFFGVFAGTFVPQEHIKCGRIVALIGFVGAAILIMRKFFSVIMEKDE